MNTPSEPEKLVAVFFDYENIVYSLRNRFEQKANFEALIQKSQEFGRIVEARAFGDWGLSFMSTALLYALQAAGFDLVFVPTGGTQENTPRKNVADLYMTMNVMDTMHNRPEITTFVLMTGDRDFMPLVNLLKRNGKKVVAIGVDGSSSYYLSQAVDEFFYYSEVEEIYQETNRRNKGRLTNIYDALVQAVQTLTERGRPTRLMPLKLMMSELMEGFDESAYTDARGRSFRQFKDFILEAQRRRLVRLVTQGRVQEVILVEQEEKQTPVEDVETEAEIENEIEESEKELDLNGAFLLLVKAVEKAQREGKSFRAASVKALMRRLNPQFDETKLVGENGKPFTRFSEFVRLAASQNYVLAAGKMSELEVRPYQPQEITPAPAEAEEDPALLTEPETRRAVLDSLRAYNRYPTSFLSLSNHIQRWCLSHNHQLDEATLRHYLTDAVDLGLIVQKRQRDGRRQYELRDEHELVQRFLDVAMGVTKPSSADYAFDEVDEETEHAPEAEEEQLASTPTPQLDLVAILQETVEELTSADKPTVTLTRVKDTMKRKHGRIDFSLYPPINGLKIEKFRDLLTAAEKQGAILVRTERHEQILTLPSLLTPQTEPKITEEKEEEKGDGDGGLDSELVRMVEASQKVAPAETPLALPSQEYTTFTPLSESAERELIVEALVTFTNYPAPFMALLAYCRELRNNRRVFISNDSLRDLLAEASKANLIIPVTPKNVRPTRYEFNHNEVNAARFLGRDLPALVKEASQQEEAETVVAQAEVMTEPSSSAEPSAPVVELREPAPVVAPSSPTKEGINLPLRQAIYAALAQVTTYPTTFNALLMVCENDDAVRATRQEALDVRAALSEAARIQLLSVTTLAGMRPVKYVLADDSALVSAFLGETVATPSESAEQPTTSNPPVETVEREESVETGNTVETQDLASPNNLSAVETPTETPEAETVEAGQQSVTIEVETPVQSVQPIVEIAPLPVATAYQWLADTIRELSASKKATRVNNVSTRLNKREGFNLQKLVDEAGQPTSFERFIDFARAAESAGYIQVAGRGLQIELLLPSEQSAE